MNPNHPQESELSLKQAATYHRAPVALRAAIQGQLRAADAVAAGARTQRLAGWWSSRWPSQWPSLWPVSGAFAAGVLATLLVVSFYGQISKDDPLLGEVVAAHVRSMQVAHLSDVVSSDQHTVKPWFAGKLDYAPPVADHAAQGYALQGGRLDYLGGRPVAALVYRYQQHVINVYVWPIQQSGEQQPRVMAVVQGFNVSAWRHLGMQYWAVSDVRAEELNTLAHLSIAVKGLK